MAGMVSQQGLLPTHQDPKLWLVETRTGQEREACIRLMQKSIDLARVGTPLAIKSCFVQDHLQVSAISCGPHNEAVLCNHYQAESITIKIDEEKLYLMSHRAAFPGAALVLGKMLQHWDRCVGLEEVGSNRVKCHHISLSLFPSPIC